MKNYTCTIGKLNCTQNNQFAGHEVIQVRAKSAKNAAMQALGTRAKLATAASHDVENVYAVDSDFGTNGYGHANVRAVMVELAQ